MTPIGTGALFSSDAEKRFRTIVRDRYRLLCARMERKKIPVMFTEEEFRTHLLKHLGSNPDGPVMSNWNPASRQRGTITASHGDAYVWVQFDGHKFSVPVHPADLLYEPEHATMTMRD